MNEDIKASEDPNLSPKKAPPALTRDQLNIGLIGKRIRSRWGNSVIEGRLAGIDARGESWQLCGDLDEATCLITIRQGRTDISIPLDPAATIEVLG